MFILVIVTIAGMFMLIRSMLILTGLYKTPVLRSFEEYGPEEKPFLPGLAIVMWTGVVIVSASLWASGLSALSFTLSCVGIVMIIAAGLGYNYAENVLKYHWMILKIPRWYYELVGRTSRYERRRIAYMWLHLSKRAHLTYNSSDTHFFTWADFVIMGTIREEELVPGQDDQIKNTYAEPKMVYLISTKTGSAKVGHD